jgi:hypothetical protein
VLNQRCADGDASGNLWNARTMFDVAILIARGRDASDVAISSTFGPNRMTSFRVWTDK